MGWLLYPLLVLGVLLLGWGGWRMYRDGRRILYAVLAVGGLGLVVLSTAVLLANSGYPLVLVLLLLAGGALVLISYPVLAIFLIVNGITVLRREQRSLGNALALLAGLGMVGLAVLLLSVPNHLGESTAGQLVLGLLVFIELVAGWVAICFVAFAVSSLLYRWLPSRRVPSAIIVLGSGLIEGRVPPLLASRLAKARAEQLDFDPTPLLITSGGQGADEPRPEGEAMREHLVRGGTPAALVVAETRSRTTRENLQLSRELLPDPDAPVLVVTSNYHAFRAAMLTRSVGLNARVVGAPTAGYFLPSALLREFVAVMRDNLKLNVAVIGLLGLAVALIWAIVPALVRTMS